MIIFQNDRLEISKTSNGYLVQQHLAKYEDGDPPNYKNEHPVKVFRIGDEDELRELLDRWLNTETIKQE